MTIRQNHDLLYCGGRLRPGEFSLPGDVSSQYISGLLMALPLLNEGSALTVTGGLESGAYVTMTEDTLRRGGVSLRKTGGTWHISGGQRLRFPDRLTAEGDWSNAAFWLCAGALTQNPEGIAVEGLSLASLQGDRAVVDILSRFGAQVESSSEGRIGTVRIKPPKSGAALRGQTIDARQIPDLVPILAVAMAAAEGESHITGAARLRIKESDRLSAMAAALTAAMPDARELILRRLAENGVTVVDPAATYVDPRCSVASGVTLLPGAILRGHTAIAAGCEIGPNSMVRDCTVGEGTTINASQVNESTIGSHTTVGPFTYVRPGCTIGDHCRVGDFVEVKNSVIGDGTKISHLTYVGDSDVGQRVNFGCGTVTTNYDGHKKHRCTIGDDVFLGCNTNLIAPVTVADRAYTAAGSTVTDDVPEGALAIARQRQTNIRGWADRLRKTWKK